MCGIHGIVTSSIQKQELLHRLKKMGHIQRHRGPDDQREAIFPIPGGLLGFGFVRLSILDLETGMQPLICKQDNSAIICNGQIYNYIELKQEVSNNQFISKGDIEVALHLYRKNGVEFLQQLNGMYAGAIYNFRNNKLLLFRDRFGIKPLYYAEWNGNFFFSSEIKPLLLGSNIPKQLNTSGLATFFTYRYLPGNETMFSGIKRLPPGSYLEYDLSTGNYTIQRYWEFGPAVENQKLSLNDAVEQFHQLFTDAVRIRLRSDVEVGSLLSGGIDSSAVSSQAAKLKPNLKLFTIGFEEKKYNELPQVKKFLANNNDRFKSTKLYTKICSKNHLNQLPNIIKSLEEPISLGTMLPTDQVCKLAASKLKVVLTGEGADEIFAGYRKFIIEAAIHEYSTASSNKQKWLKKKYPELELHLAQQNGNQTERHIRTEALFRPDELNKLLGRTVSDNLFPENALPNLNGSEHPLNAMIAFECRSRLPDYVILRLDKLSMRHSLETRTPLLDFRLAEFAATLPIKYKINPNTGQAKFICSYSYDTYSVLDRETSNRGKLPFTIPLANWLADPGSLPDFMQEILLGDMVETHGILNPKMITNHVNNITTKGIGPKTLVSEADRIFAVIIFSLWYNEFFSD